MRAQIEAPDKSTIFDQLLFSNVDDATGKMLDTIVKKGHSFVTRQGGVYGFCFDNKMSRWTAKVVTFDLDVTTSDEARADAIASGIPIKGAAGEHRRTDLLCWETWNATAFAILQASSCFHL